MIALALLAAALRIVSLAPALTEDLFTVGAGPQVVGVDRYSDRPSAAAALPRVGSMQDINAEAILALRADLVVGISYQARALADLARVGIRTQVFDLNDLAGDFRAIEGLADLSGHRSEGRAAVRRIRIRLAELSTVARRERPLRGFAVVGFSPIYTAGAGSFIDELMGLANVRNVAHGTRTPWPAYSAERLMLDQPEVLIVPDTQPPLTGTPWDQLRAVRAGRIARVPEGDLLRPGPRVADALAELTEQLKQWR